MPVPDNCPSGNEDLYKSKIGGYHKELPHNEIGEVDALQADANSLCVVRQSTRVCLLVLKTWNRYLAWRDFY